MITRLAENFTHKMKGAETIYAAVVKIFIHKMMGAEKIYAAVVKLAASIRSELTQRSQSVFAALLHVHCLLEAPHLLAPVASRYHFVGSSHGPEKTALVGDHVVSDFQSASWFCCLT